ncbi:antirestriction protein ArdA [Lacrimispora sp.]|uniref:antirestriction protein ArdA n=1 Tax=Lacrimispora sp. TaxID=2719234 RepID=UPI0028A971AD|nr:antirestriction protein ArdA [Lacrimispora sp.]
MLEIKLKKYDSLSQSAIILKFPASEPDLQKAMNEIGVGITIEKQCMVDAVRNDDGGLQALVGTVVNVDEIQYLAKRMDSFDKIELKTFYAVARQEKLAAVKDLINLTFNLQCYSLISDFADVSAIGKRYELDRRSAMTVEEMRTMDFAAIGKDLLDSNKGIVTPYGVLYSTGNTPEQVYNGEQFPEYYWRGDEMATVILESGDYQSGIKYEYLYLPCYEVEVEKALNRLGVKSLHSCATHLICEDMSEQLYEFFTEEFPLSENLYTLNKLAKSYAGFDESSRNTFHDIVDMIHPKTPEDVILLADNFHEFTVVPGLRTPEEYGRYMIIKSGNYTFDESLEEFIDFKKYGEQRIQKEKGVFTDYGYIAYNGFSPAVETLLERNNSRNMEMGGMNL